MTTEWEEIAQPALRHIHAWESEQGSDGHDARDLAQALDKAYPNGGQFPLHVARFV